MGSFKSCRDVLETKLQSEEWELEKIVANKEYTRRHETTLNRHSNANLPIISSSIHCKNDALRPSVTCLVAGAIYCFRDPYVLVGAKGYFGRLWSHATPFTLPPTTPQNRCLAEAYWDVKDGLITFCGTL
ncbi:unnamed protein product [Timema podura]|uniref:Uncharacterized protein n=1 Tax=Timema podura TaxID=61482 RepID=A0ABN7P5L3_TIMPD|nr:unnamed protein product [Timema podura]